MLFYKFDTHTLYISYDIYYNIKGKRKLKKKLYAVKSTISIPYPMPQS